MLLFIAVIIAGAIVFGGCCLIDKMLGIAPFEEPHFGIKIILSIFGMLIVGAAGWTILYN